VSAVPTMPGMPGRPRPLLRGTATALAVLALGAGLGACGTDAETTYADGWDGVCGDVGDALRTFRTAVSSAATVSPDDGDAAAAAGPTPAAVRSDLLEPAQALRTALAEQGQAAGRLDPPARWARWHAAELRRIAVRGRAIDVAVRRLGRGDADAPLLAVGGVGPSSVRAPADLRDRTPECTTLR
jgi:hypothetical protein